MLKLDLFGSKEYSLEILAPNLQSLGLFSCEMGKYVLKDTLSLIQAHVEFVRSEKLKNFACWSDLLRSLGSVERLTIKNMWMSEFEKVEEPMHYNDGLLKKKPKIGNNEDPVSAEEEFHGELLPAGDVLSGNFSFNNLKHLELLTGYTIHDLLGLEASLNICPRLESLVLNYSYMRDGDENLGEEMRDRPIILSMPCLRIIHTKKYKGTETELYVVGLLKRHKKVLERVLAFPANDGGTYVSPFAH